LQFLINVRKGNPNILLNFRLSHNNIMVSHYSKEDTRSIPNPVLRFDQAFGHYPELLEAVSSQGFSEPSPIQSQSWPILLKGYDMIGIAQTGTGKTLAFLLPAMVHIQGQPTPRDQRDGPTILVMAPTRELAQQIEREVKKFPYKGIKW
jgi:ATP-dependent RNA helicase DDX43